MLETFLPYVIVAVAGWALRSFMGKTPSPASPATSSDPDIPPQLLDVLKKFLAKQRTKETERLIQDLANHKP